MLGDIRNYLKRRQTASLAEIATHFDISQEAAKLAVDYWVKKGKAKNVAMACGSSCGSCNDGNENYEWVGQAKRIRWFRMNIKNI